MDSQVVNSKLEEIVKDFLTIFFLLTYISESIMKICLGNIIKI